MTTGLQQESLTEKLRMQVSAQLAEADKLTKSELQQYAQNLSLLCNDVLTKTESDIRSQSQSLQGLQSEAQSTIEALKQTLEIARKLELSSSDQYQISEHLTEQIKAEQQKAIKEAIKPLQVALNNLNREAQRLSKTTAKSWLKPLAIGGAIAISILVVTTAGTLTLDKLISSRVAVLSDLQNQIREAEQTLNRLPVGVEFIQDSRTGNSFITAPKLSAPFTHQGRQYVQIED